MTTSRLHRSQMVFKRDWFGHSQDSSDEYLDGQIDDFCNYNRALSASEFRAYFQNP